MLLKCLNNSINQTQFIQIVPNPISDNLKIEFAANEKRSIQIYNTTSRIIFSRKNATEKTILILTESWAEGIYSIQIHEAEKNLHSKLIKIH